MSKARNLIPSLILSLITASTASAFLPPDMIRLLSTSFTTTIYGFISILLVNGYVWVKRVGWGLRRAIIIASLVALACLLFFSIQRLHTLTQLNEQKLSYTEWKEFMSGLGFQVRDNYTREDLKRTINIQEGDIFIPYTNKTVRRINLDEALENGSYRIFSVFYAPVKLKNSELTDFYRLEERPYDEEMFQEITSAYNLTKNDKIVVYCHSGGNSKVVAVILAYYGYDVWYSDLSDVTNPDVIQVSGINESEANNILVDTLTPDNKDVYVFFLITKRDMYILDSPIISKMGEDRIKFVRYKDNVDDSRFYELNKTHLLTDIRDIDLTKSKILCTTRVHCYLTKLFLLYSGENHIDTIYSIDANTSNG